MIKKYFFRRLLSRKLQSLELVVNQQVMQLTMLKRVRVRVSVRVSSVYWKVTSLTSF